MSNKKSYRTNKKGGAKPDASAGPNQVTRNIAHLPHTKEQLVTSALYPPIRNIKKIPNMKNKIHIIQNYSKYLPTITNPKPKNNNNNLYGGATRKCPKNPAKEFKLKTVKKGLDGKQWIVSKRSDGIKVWKRKVSKK